MVLPFTLRYGSSRKPERSFKIGTAFGVKRMEKSKEGHVIIRESSSEYYTEETFDERFARILRRSVHQDIKFLFDRSDRGASEWIRATLASSSFRGLLVILDGRLEVRALAACRT
jgi:hypothetical protein